MADRIGVYVCECGPNIAGNVDIDKILTVVSSINNVVIAQRYKLLCSEDGKKFLEEEIKKNNLSHLVIAACSPRQHETTFMEVCKKAALNPYLFQLVNIREQCAWITKDKKEATEKAIRYIRAGISRVRYHKPLEKREVEMNPDVLVIGGGIAGMETSLLLASKDRKVYLVEKTAALGGAVVNFEKLFPNMISGFSTIEGMIQDIKKNDNIEVFTNTLIEQALGFSGNFVVKAKRKEESEEIEFRVGAVVVTTGFSLFNPQELTSYGYGRFDDVYTALEFERMNKAGKILLKDGKPPESVAIIHCVGRKEKGYCSRICCLYSLKFSRYLKAKIPEVKVFHFYSDLCIPGKTYQKFYEETKNDGVDFIRAGEVEITERSKGMAVKYDKKSLPVDIVILAPAIQPSPDASKIAEMLKISQDDSGFFSEEHEKLAPVSTSMEGVFIAGCAQGPKDIPDSIVQSEAVAGRILSSIVPGRKLELEARTSEISEALCIGCQTCLSVCSYGAISFDERKRVSVVNEILCRGCGNCAAACPSGAAMLKHFTSKQIYHELMEVLR
ncbi:MAG: pyridine nucleotide-disulfide oxidoreductase [Candidatus Cloacimonas sp. 4484_209]|nr:MAG: pyridine nucleotide-disulfide oxidoreductase [Candidatus Cloacimonas sp. 4484_209]